MIFVKEIHHDSTNVQSLSLLLMVQQLCHLHGLNCDCYEGFHMIQHLTLVFMLMVHLGVLLVWDKFLAKMLPISKILLAHHPLQGDLDTNAPLMLINPLVKHLHKVFLGSKHSRSYSRNKSNILR